MRKLIWEGNEKRFNRKVTDFDEMLSPTAFPAEIEFNFKGTLQIIYNFKGFFSLRFRFRCTIPES